MSLHVNKNFHLRNTRVTSGSARKRAEQYSVPGTQYSEKTKPISLDSVRAPNSARNDKSFIEIEMLSLDTGY